MASERLIERYREALRYYADPISELARMANGDAGEYEFCRGYVQTSYRDRSSRWDDDEHMQAYEAAREGAGDVLEMDVSKM